MIRVACLAAASALAAQAFIVPVAEAAEDQKGQFMAACLKKPNMKMHVCECTYEGFSSAAKPRDVELMIAFLNDDKKRQEEIKSDPSFDYEAYNARGVSALTKSADCLLNRKK